MDEAKHKNTMDSNENLSSSRSPEQVIIPNCFEPWNRVKSDDGELVDHMESYLTGDLESVDLNDTSSDCLERSSPYLTDTTSTSMTDSANASITDSPTSVYSESQTSKKKK